jgi:ankyrin repeat protein
MIATGNLVKALLDRGADVNSRGPKGLTALMSATSSGDLDKLRLLLDGGAELNARNDSKYAVIQLAATSGRREVFILLRERGADVSMFPRGLSIYC